MNWPDSSREIDVCWGDSLRGWQVEKYHVKGEYPSGQRGQTVNLVALAFAGSNPASPIPVCGAPVKGGLFAGFIRGIRHFEFRQVSGTFARMRF